MRWDTSLLVATLATCACSVATKPLPDKSTNWLQTCQSDAECGADLSCACGLCTTSCGEQRDCASSERDAKCVPLPESSDCRAPRGAVAICVPSCTRDADCLATGEDFRCTAGVCTRSQRPPTEPDAGSDARTSDCNGQTCEEGWSCVQGLCGKAILTGSHLPGSVLLHDGELYVTANASSDMLGNKRRDAALLAISLPAGSVAMLVSDELQVDGLALDATHAYWFSGTDERAGAKLVSMPLAGGTRKELVSGVTALSGLTADADFVYWIEFDGVERPAKLARCGKGGCMAPEMRMELEANSSMLTLQNGRFYFPNANGLWSGLAGAAAAEKLAEGPTASVPQLLAADDSGVYWTWANGSDVGMAVYAEQDPRVLQLGGQTGALNTNAFALDGRYAYWIHTNRLGTSGTLVQSDKTPGESKALLTAAMLAQTRIAVDDDYIYLVSALAVPDQLTLLRMRK